MIDGLKDVTYDILDHAAYLIDRDDEFDLLCRQVRRNVEAAMRDDKDLEPSIAREHYGTILFLNMMSDNIDKAKHNIEQIRALTQKSSLRLITHIVTEGIAEALQGHEQRKRLRKYLRNRLNSLPWNIVGSEIKRLRADFELLSKDLVDGLVRANCAEIHVVGRPIKHDTAVFLIRMRFYRDMVIPFADDVREVLNEAIDAHEALVVSARSSPPVQLSESSEATSVVIGIWDSGVDTEHFADRMAMSGGRNSIAWDRDGQPTQGALRNIPADKLKRLPELIDLVHGFGDTRVGIISSYSKRFEQKVSLLAADELIPFLEELELIADYVHGTHLAGVAIYGNPYARLLSARLTWEHRFTIDAEVSGPRLERQINLYRETLRFFGEGGTRVINVSWNRHPNLYASTSDSDEARHHSRRLYELDKANLCTLMAEFKDILFVVAAGNSDQNVIHSGIFPASFDLTNLIVVGAADKDGNACSFTNYGGVRMVYAEGLDVTACGPGGTTISLSGTSVAAARVTSLAAKILALRPSLTPPEIIDLMLSSACKSRDGTDLICDTQAIAALEGPPVSHPGRAR